MNKLLRNNRFFIMRRLTQITIMGLFISSYYYGNKLLVGNLSQAKFFGVIPLSDPLAVLQILATLSMITLDVFLGLLVVLFLYGLLFGRAYCSWVCPLNIITEFARWLRKVFKQDDFGLRIHLRRDFRYIFLIMTILVTMAFGTAAFELISPISILHRGLIYGMGFGWAVLLAILIFDFLFLKEGFCGHICPLGAFYSLIGRFSLIRVKYSKNSCSDCRECLKTCPEHQVLDMIGKESKAVTNGECLNCGRCVESCPTGSLGFGFRFTK